jgi:hypothetical protein
MNEQANWQTLKGVRPGARIAAGTANGPTSAFFILIKRGRWEIITEDTDGRIRTFHGGTATKFWVIK